MCALGAVLGGRGAAGRLYGVGGRWGSLRRVLGLHGDGLSLQDLPSEGVLLPATGVLAGQLVEEALEVLAVQRLEGCRTVKY